MSLPMGLVLRIKSVSPCESADLEWQIYDHSRKPIFCDDKFSPLLEKAFMESIKDDVKVKLAQMKFLQIRLKQSLTTYGGEC